MNEPYYLDHESDPLKESFTETRVEEGHESWAMHYASTLICITGLFASLFAYSTRLQFDFGFNSVQSAATRAELVDSAEILKTRISQLVSLKDLVIETHPSGIDISFESGAIYRPGLAELMPEPDYQIRKLIEVVKTSAHPFNVVVEGYTDIGPVLANNKRYPSNWELSGARAFHIVRMFEKAGIPGVRLAGVGYGQNRPIKGVDQNTFDGRLKNRRAKIKLLYPY